MDLFLLQKLSHKNGFSIKKLQDCFAIEQRN